MYAAIICSGYARRKREDVFAAAMAARAHENQSIFPLTVDATVGTVGPTALLHGLVDLDVRDNQLLGVQATELDR